MPNISDSYLEDYIDKKFNNFSSEGGILALASEIMDYVTSAKNRRLSEISREQIQ